MTRRRGRTWAVSCLLAGCATSPQPVPAPPTPPASETPSVVDEIVRYAPGVDRRDVHELGRGFVVGATGLVVATRVPAEACMRLDLGLSDGIEDADLTVFDRAGRALAVDDGSSRYAAVMLCPSEDLDVHIRALAARGAGELTIGARTVDAEESRRSVMPARAVHRGLVGPGDALHARAVEALDALGFRREAGPTAVEIAADAPSYVGLPNRPDECVHVRARPRDGATRLVLQDDRGTVVAEDEGAGRDLAVVHCSVSARTLSAVLTSESATTVDVVVFRGLARDVAGASVSVATER